MFCFFAKCSYNKLYGFNVLNTGEKCVVKRVLVPTLPPLVGFQFRVPDERSSLDFSPSSSPDIRPFSPPPIPPHTGAPTTQSSLQGLLES